MFLFAMIVSLADIIKRGRNHEALTGGEAALLRLFDGVTVAVLLAGWAAFQRYGPALPAVHDIAGATMAAVLLAWQKWAAGSGLAQLEASVSLAPGNLGAYEGLPPAGAASGGSVAPEPPTGATAFARSAPAQPPAAAALRIPGATVPLAPGETEGDWDGEEAAAPPTASGRYRTLANMPHVAPPPASAVTQPATIPAWDAAGNTAGPPPASPVRTPAWLLDQPTMPPGPQSTPDPGATQVASGSLATMPTAAATADPQQEGPNQ